MLFPTHSPISRHAASRLLVSTSVFALVLAGATTAPALAASTTISAGTATQQVLSAGDVLTVESTGSIAVNAQPSVVDDGFGGGTITIINHGNISPTGNDGIHATTTDVILNNSGVIHGIQDGVTSVMGFLSVTNSGTIQGPNFRGVYADGNINTVTNSGDISGQVYGLRTLATLGSLSNSGTIIGSDGGGVIATNIGTISNTGSLSSTLGWGVFSSTDIASLVNSGTIKSQNVAAVMTGNGAGNDLNSLNNSGLIQGGTHGVQVGGNIGNLVNSGSIIGDTFNGVMAGTMGTVNNSGDISGVGGIGFNASSVVSLTNSGVISGTDGVSVADLTSLTNTATGTITATSFAVNATNLGTINNAGRITGGKGVNVNTSLGSLVNTGAITGTAQSALEIATLGSLNNSGTITGAEYGVLVYAGTASNLTNSGKIQGVLGGVQTVGLLSLTNSGTIAGTSPSDNAIVETNPGLATDTVLNLNAGSILIGHVDIHGGTNTLNVGPGLNLALTFDTSPPEIIKSGSSAHVVVGNTVYVGDASTFLASNASTANLSGAIAGLAGGALDKGFDEKGVDGSTNYWMEAIGGLSSQQANNGTAASQSAFGGFAAGADFGPDADTRFGAFVGAARGVVDSGNQSDTTDSFYAGIYGGGQFADFSVKGTLSAGATRGTGNRVVANNTLATGLETISGGGNGYFISPGIVLSKPWVTSDLSFETSLALNYTGVFSGGYAETTGVGMTVDAATTHVFEAEALLRLPMQTPTANGMLTGDLHTGVEGRVIANPGVTGTLGGVATTYSTANVVMTAGAVAGGALALKFDGGGTLFSGLDATLRTDTSITVAGNVGFKGSF